MNEHLLEGRVSFVHHDKHYVTIEYTDKGKLKSVNGKVDEQRQAKLIEQKIIKKNHQFQEGDEVYFVLERSARGDKMVAESIRFRYNNTVNNLLNRAAKDNRFTGYLKLAEDKYYVKETTTHVFFPLLLSPWQLPPSAQALNEPVQFTLQQVGSGKKANAVLLHPKFIPQYLAAEKYYANKKIINATVYKVSEHGIYVHLFDEKLQAKLATTDIAADALPKAGDSIAVRISYLSPGKIAVAKA